MQGCGDGTPKSARGEGLLGLFPGGGGSGRRWVGECGLERGGFGASGFRSGPVRDCLGYLFPVNPGREGINR